MRAFAITSTSPRRPGTALFLLLLCLLVLLPGLDRLPVARMPELRVLLTAREMNDSGDWLVPRFLGEERLRKPPVMYWLCAAAMRVADGHETSPVAGRLVGVLFATALVLAIHRFGARLVGPRRAFLAAVIAASTLLFLHHARLAQTDFTFTFFIFLAGMAGYAAVTQPRHWRWWLLMGAAMGAGFMVKGPAAMAIPALGLLVYAGLTPRHRSRAIAGRLVMALLLCLAMALPWYLAILFKSGDPAAAIRQIQQEVDSNYIEGHRKEPLLFYFYTLPDVLLPWGALLPFALWGMWRRARHHQGTRFLLCWFAATFVLLTFNSGRREHYTTLLFAQSVLALGWYVGHVHRALRCRLRPVVGWLLVAMLALVALAGTATALTPAFRSGLPLLPCLVAGPLAALVAVLALRRRTPSRSVAAIGLGLALLVVPYMTVLNPLKDGRSILAPFASDVLRRVPPGQAIHIAGPHAASLVFYLHRPFVLCASPGDPLSDAASGDAVVLTGKRSRPLPDAVAALRPLIDASNRDLRCLLYRKP